MREHKYRAWDKEEKRFWTQKEMTEIGGYYYTWGLGNFNGRFILMEFIGLLDKNKKEIYEEDIVEIAETYIGDSKILKHTTEIIFENGSFNIRSDAMFDMLAINPKYWEKIGNRRENPELLEK